MNILTESVIAGISLALSVAATVITVLLIVLAAILFLRLLDWAFEKVHEWLAEDD